MTRRLFLGLIGSAIAAAATPEEFFQLTQRAPAPGPTTWRRVSSLWLLSPARGTYEIQRASGETLLRIGLAKGGIYHWSAIGGYEIVLRPNEPALCVAGPADPEWSMVWGDDEHTYTTKSRGWVQILGETA